MHEKEESPTSFILQLEVMPHDAKFCMLLITSEHWACVLNVCTQSLPHSSGSFSRCNRSGRNRRPYPPVQADAAGQFTANWGSHAFVFISNRQAGAHSQTTPSVSRHRHRRSGHPSLGLLPATLLTLCGSVGHPLHSNCGGLRYRRGRFLRCCRLLKAAAGPQVSRE